jgi:hypothetical protein
MATCGPKGHEYSWGHACMPPPLWHPCMRIETCYLYEKSPFFSGNPNRCIAMRPVPQWETGGAGGGLKK